MGPAHSGFADLPGTLTLEGKGISLRVQKNFMATNSLVKRNLYDKIAAYVVKTGGVIIIFSILAILFVILLEVYPLFKSPKYELVQKGSVPVKSSSVFEIGSDEYREIGYQITRDGIRFFSLKEDKEIKGAPTLDLGGARVVTSSRSNHEFLALGLSDGRVLPLQVKFITTYGKDARTVSPAIELQKPFYLTSDKSPVSNIAVAKGEKGYRIAADLGDGQLALFTIMRRKTLMGTTIEKNYEKKISIPVKGNITAMVMNSEASAVLIGSSSGQIIKVAIGDFGSDSVEAHTLGAVPIESGKVTTLGFLIGNQTFVVGDESGHISSYQIFRGDDDKFHMNKVHSFESHAGPILFFHASPRDKGFITGSPDGVVKYHFGTIGNTQFEVQISEHKLAKAQLTPKTDGLIAVSESGAYYHWEVDNPHPNISWSTLFQEMTYEGYKESDYVWQSTGGTDEFEPKFSLVPLIIGTLKGTFYALMFAIPLALFGAFYTSQFMHERFKAFVKPVIEIMAALPSVVLGFFAALWLAPIVEELLPGLVVAPFMIFALVTLALLAFERLPVSIRVKWKPGTEIFILMVVVIVGSYLAFPLGREIETIFLNSDYRGWMLETLNISFDQRNSLVVGLAMGFAVTPMIFTISEDSLSNVPGHLTATSLALGATPWQTAMRVVLPTASPGIFSAVMIGFGRAIGETMIVLMATGNTPVMDWNVFSGFRALSANIAVELPEAPEGGTLFRILFLAAFILFIMTFAVNTLAEWVRLRLRERYRVL